MYTTRNLIGIAVFCVTRLETTATATNLFNAYYVSNPTSRNKTVKMNGAPDKT